VINYGFIDLVDPEWPKPFKKGVARLWALYEESNSGRIEENLCYAKVVYNTVEWKKEVEKKYISLPGDVKKCMNAAEKKMRGDNMRKI
jgi:hypothetical protein